MKNTISLFVLSFFGIIGFILHTKNSFRLLFTQISEYFATIKKPDKKILRDEKSQQKSRRLLKPATRFLFKFNIRSTEQTTPTEPRKNYKVFKTSPTSFISTLPA